MLKNIVLLFLAFVTPGCALTLNGFMGEANYADFSQAEEKGSEKCLAARVDLNVGELQIEPGPPDRAYELALRYNELAFKPSVEFQRSDDQARLSVELEGEGSHFRNIGETIIRLGLNPETALDLDASTGMGQSTVDLTGMTVTSVVVQSGVGETTLSMLEPNKSVCDRIEVSSGVGEFDIIGLGHFRFKEFSFRGGVGESKLDFSGDWDEIGEVLVEVGVGGVEILLPRDLGAEIRVSKGFFSDFQMPGFRKRGDTYFSENSDRVDKILRFRIRAGIGGVNVKWI